MQKQFIEVLYWSKGHQHIQIRLYALDDIVQKGWTTNTWNTTPEGWFMPTSEVWGLQVPQ